jgi:hypothetical protein
MFRVEVTFIIAAVSRYVRDEDQPGAYERRHPQKPMAADFQHSLRFLGRRSGLFELWIMRITNGYSVRSM